MTLCNVFFGLEQELLNLNVEQNIIKMGVEQSVLDFNVECVISQPEGPAEFLLQESGDFILQEDNSKIKI